jgi:hypothetical protein
MAWFPVTTEIQVRRINKVTWSKHKGEEEQADMLVASVEIWSESPYDPRSNISRESEHCDDQHPLFSINSR